MTKKTGMEGTYSIDYALRKIDKIMIEVTYANNENKRSFYKLKEEIARLKELNREMTNALIEIKEYWGGSPEGALDAIQHVNEIANWILAKARGEGE